MLTFTIRRLITSIPTLLFISIVIFALLKLAPGDPMAQVPLTVPPEVKQKMREALGLGAPAYVQYFKWLNQFFIVEPQFLIDWMTRDSALFGWLPDTQFSMMYDPELQKLVPQQRTISYQTRSPIMDIVIQRIPQTLWVVFRGRSSRHVYHDGRLLDPTVLHRSPVDRDLLGLIRLAPLNL
jgi:peptide/nickel transport system permease protein